MGSDPELRDSSSAALGALQKCVGEQALTMILKNSILADERKMAKVWNLNTFLYDFFYFYRSGKTKLKQKKRMLN